MIDSRVLRKLRTFLVLSLWIANVPCMFLLDEAMAVVPGRGGLHLAAMRGDLAEVKILLKAGHDPRAKDSRDYYPFELAAKAGHARVASELLEQMAHESFKDDKGWTAMNWAIVSGDKERIAELIDKGAKLGEGCQNALEVSLIMGDLETFHCLHKVSGVDVPSRRGDTALMSVSKRGDVELASALLDFGADPNATDNERFLTGLRFAAEEGHDKMAILLLNNGAHPNYLDFMGDTPLIWAAMRGHGSMVNILLERGADANILNDSEMSALDWAAYKGHQDVVEQLLPHIVDKSKTWKAAALAEAADHHRTAKTIQKDALRGSNFGKTKAYKKLKENYPSILKELEENLLRATNRGDEAEVEKLLSLGANPDAVDVFGNPLLVNAAYLGHKGVLKVFLEYGADPDVLDSNGLTGMMYAVSRSYLEMIEPLLLKGADRSIKSPSGKTAEQMASGKYKYKILDIFEDHTSE